MDTKIVLDQDKINSRKLYYIIKRTFDVLASFIGLIILSPIFLVISIVIKVSDGGPIIYRQTRVGKNGKTFTMYKFRSMVVNADQMLQQLQASNEIEGAMFKIKEDPRITNVGSFLRKHSLDELPQLINVLKGNMSLVGPRPPLPAEVAKYTDYDKQRLYVTPGCTGLWQCTERNNVGFRAMVALDLQYIDGANCWVDLKILLKTILIIFKPNGSY